ncbi:MAG: class I SAM-dependent methyltransferase [Desulfatirhabdiaceae bacterium]
MINRILSLNNITMSYIFDFHTSRSYAQWWDQPKHQNAASLHASLMRDMLKPIRGKTILDVGCGAGQSLISHIDSGLSVTGINPSPYMLEIAHQKAAHRAEFFRSSPEDLPFEDNAFHYTSLVFSLEFVPDPVAALREIFRVTRDRVYIGLINKYALNGFSRQIKQVFPKPVRRQIRFFSAWKIRRICRLLLGDVPITSQTIGYVPCYRGQLINRIEQSGFMKSMPFGAFAGIVVSMTPRYRTRPLALEIKTGQPVRAMPMHLKNSNPEWPECASKRFILENAGHAEQFNKCPGKGIILNEGTINL